MAEPVPARGQPEWYRQAFGGGYRIVYAHRDEATAKEEVAFVLPRLRLPPGASVLDVGCGAGRHLRAILSHQHQIHTFGIDLSQDLLGDAVRGSGGRAARADMRRLPFGGAAFDAVVSFFTSFGYFPTQAEDELVLAQIARVLRPGGRFFFDFLEAAYVAASLVPRTERVAGGSARVVETRRIEGGRVKKQVEITEADWKEPLAYEESVRLYERRELESMLWAAHLLPLCWFGAYDGRPAGSGPRLLGFCERAP